MNDLVRPFILFISIFSSVILSMKYEWFAHGLVIWFLIIGIYHIIKDIVTGD